MVEGYWYGVRFTIVSMDLIALLILAILLLIFLAGTLDDVFTDEVHHKHMRRLKKTFYFLIAILIFLG